MIMIKEKRKLKTKKEGEKGRELAEEHNEERYKK
jgi:hypothetical protein